MLRDETTDEINVVVGDDAVSVAQRSLHALNGSSVGSGTRGPNAGHLAEPLGAAIKLRRIRAYLPAPHA